MGVKVEDIEGNEMEERKHQEIKASKSEKKVIKSQGKNHEYKKQVNRQRDKMSKEKWLICIPIFCSIYFNWTWQPWRQIISYFYSHQ